MTPGKQRTNNTPFFATTNFGGRDLLRNCIFCIFLDELGNQIKENYKELRLKKCDMFFFFGNFNHNFIKLV